MTLRIFRSAMLAWLIGLAPVASTWASEELRISSTVEFDRDWLENALPDQRRFITNLTNQTMAVTFDLVPHNRFDDLLGRGETDCILTALPNEFPNSVVAQNRISFELRVFQRKDQDVTQMPKIDIGFLVNLPRPKVPLTAELVWHDLRTIEQGVDLLRAGRLDAIVGDSTHIRTYGATGLVAAELPPVLIPRMSLVCRDTEQIRDFVASFDASMARPGSGDGENENGQ